MENAVFIAVLSGLFIPFLWWSFKVLPAEKWQIMASIPVRKKDNNSWAGVNYTFYGFFVAGAQSFSVVMMLILTMSIGVSFGAAMLGIAGILMVCLPASRIVAGLVEKRAYTFTVAGATFVGMICAPFVLLLLNICGFSLPLLPVLAAFSISYAFGEGIGRIACISFGCCYGKPLAKLGSVGRIFFRKMNFVFTGPNKKIAYEGDLENCEVLPVQAITSLIYIAAGIVATGLFLTAAYRLSFILVMVVTQMWRCYSETLRADYRGGGRISAYQIMAIISVLYVLGVVWLLGPYRADELPRIMHGLDAMASALPILFVQGVWLVVFIFFGRSSVTGADISFHINHDAV